MEVSKIYPYVLKNSSGTGNIQGSPVRLYIDGIFDLFHYGHARALKQAKELFSNGYLIVGVCSSEDTSKIKGKTIMSTEERAELVLHCRYVDEVIVGCPWVLDEDYIRKYQIDYVVHGEDSSYDENGNDAYHKVKSLGKFKTIKRTDGISTSDIIIRMLKNYPDYVERSIRRGYTQKDMNISDSDWV